MWRLVFLSFVSLFPPWKSEAPFHHQKVPTLYFATGEDDKIHSPEDGPDRLNIAGMQRISAMLTELITTLATTPKRPEFRELESEHPQTAE